MANILLEKQGRILIPKPIRDRLKLRSGEKISIVVEGNKIVLRPYKDIKEFSTQLRGCIKGSTIDPLELKKMWKM